MNFLFCLAYIEPSRAPYISLIYKFYCLFYIFHHWNVRSLWAKMTVCYLMCDRYSNNEWEVIISFIWPTHRKKQVKKVIDLARS